MRIERSSTNKITSQQQESQSTNRPVRTSEIKKGVAGVKDNVEVFAPKPAGFDRFSAAINNSGAGRPGRLNEVGRQPGAAMEGPSSNNDSGASALADVLNRTPLGAKLAAKLDAHLVNHADAGARVAGSQPGQAATLPEFGVSQSKINGMNDWRKENAKNMGAAQYGERSVDAHLSRFTPNLQGFGGIGSFGKGLVSDSGYSSSSSWNVGSKGIGKTTTTTSSVFQGSLYQSATVTNEKGVSWGGGSYESNKTEKTTSVLTQFGDSKSSSSTEVTNYYDSKGRLTKKVETNSHTNADGKTTTTTTENQYDSNGNNTTSTTSTTTTQPSQPGVDDPVPSDFQPAPEEVQNMREELQKFLGERDFTKHLYEITGNTGQTGGEAVNPGSEGTYYAGGTGAGRAVEYTKETLLGGDGAEDIERPGASANPYATQDGGATDPEEKNN